MKKTFIRKIAAIVFMLGCIGLTGCNLGNTANNGETDPQSLGIKAEPIYPKVEIELKNPEAKSEPQNSEEEADTGAWKEGTTYYDDYRIDIKGPRVGHPSVGTEWSTYYELDDGTDVNVDIICIDGSLEERISQLENEKIEVIEGVIWDNDCYFYIDEITKAMIKLGEEVYLQVELGTNDGEAVEISEISDEFTLTIGSRFGY